MGLKNLKQGRSKVGLSAELTGMQKSSHSDSLTGGISWPGRQERLQVTRRTTPENTREKKIRKKIQAQSLQPVQQGKEQGDEQHKVLEPSRGSKGCPAPATNQAQI